MLKVLREFLPTFNEFLNKLLGPFATAVIIIIDIIMILIITEVLVRLAKKIVRKHFEMKMQRTNNASRYATIGKLFEHAAVGVLWYIAAVGVLSELELTTTVTSMLATAGIGGVAIGLGAQSLIKDMINGGFLLAEEQIAVGDYVTMAGVTGTVEDVNMRTTRLRATSGELYIVPNSTVSVVTNYSRGTNRAVVDVPMPQSEDPERVAEILEAAMDTYYEKHKDQLREKPKVVGIVEYGSAVMMRIAARCKNLAHWDTEKKIHEEVLKVFEKNGIAMPSNSFVITQHSNTEKREDKK